MYIMNKVSLMQARKRSPIPPAIFSPLCSSVIFICLLTSLPRSVPLFFHFLDLLPSAPLPLLLLLFSSSSLATSYLSLAPLLVNHLSLSLPSFLSFFPPPLSLLYLPFPSFFLSSLSPPVSFLSLLFLLPLLFSLHFLSLLSSPFPLPKWGTLGRAQDRASAASRNDVLVKEPSAPNRLY